VLGLDISIREHRQLFFIDKMSEKLESGVPRISAGVSIIYGLPGAGKSYFLACLADEFLRKGYSVCSNYPIKGTRQITKENINTDLCLSNCVILLDEAHTLFNSRGFKNFNQTCHEFFSLHRHLGNKIYLVTQHPARLDVIIREIAEDFILLDSFKLFGCPLWVAARYYFEDPCRSLSLDMDKHMKPYYTERRLYRVPIMMMYDSFYVDTSNHTIISADSLPLWSDSAFSGVTVPVTLFRKVFNKLRSISICLMTLIKNKGAQGLHILRKMGKSKK